MEGCPIQKEEPFPDLIDPTELLKPSPAEQPVWANLKTDPKARLCDGQQR